MKVGDTGPAARLQPPSEPAWLILAGCQADAVSLWALNLGDGRWGLVCTLGGWPQWAPSLLCEVTTVIEELINTLHLSSLTGLRGSGPPRQLRQG